QGRKPSETKPSQPTCHTLTKIRPALAPRTGPLQKWFGILPKEGQWENTFTCDKRTGRMTLNGQVIAK
ncbi:MAG: hypothetical protein EAZ82_13125, partial [Verrucomicrobia bacterium]